ncbi:UvrD-helicase domain-containing protein [Corynebacterium cystitidis]|uniref:DNA 3'-5' helicase n=1 Tax=Corynebacterium cystitidis DSM 20524 TaxID=1121357 RepID=A0A1H9SSI7_9CORY|nr:UvrD-helicase domain-containing protein [Corynebacterium cystitidis]WJY83166.1 ATP-dependent helicase/nuclease subunit A [Corynebacterium cystitidis DSM 20524]SER87837.1 ATP-dependent helicase/nuclease subunit A [Corynebacterium cystitidis DSM 20524]SNV67006.1 ATP-dependent DNA helicase [Corynebacterium cystitidis]
MAHPADHKFRTQITYDTDTSYFVEAGAGSGKTFLLVQRLITLLIDDGVALNRLAAITFTEKASEELVNRLRTALTEVEQTGRLQVHGDYREFKAPDARDRARRALGDLPGAAIETLHSFCLRLISMYPLAVGVPPTVRKSSDLGASFNALLRAESTMQFIDQVVTSPEGMADEIRGLNIGVEPTVVAEAIDWLLAAGMTSGNIEEIALFMDDHWGELSTDPKEPASGGALPEKQELDKAYVTEVVSDLQEIAALCTNESDKWYQEKLAPTIDYVAELIRQPGDLITGADRELFSKVGRGGANGNWKEPVKDVKARFSAHADTWSRRALGPVSYHAGVLRRLLTALTLRDADQRRRTGELEYHDMIYLAARLVDNPEVCKALSQHFRMIAIDEFQDTDPAQLDIINKIVAGQPGHRFTVGDPKQSIYRFRRADLDTYLTAREAAEQHGEVLKLTANFRSDQAVVGAINSLFAGMFDNLPEPNPALPASPKAVPYVAMDATSAAPGYVAFLCPEYDEADAELSILDHQRAELNHIAAAVRQAYAGTLIGTPVPLNDIAVLVPTHNNALAVVEKLTADGIPAITEGSQKVYTAPEIENLTSILRAIADPANRLATTIALRSPSFGLSDQDLADAAQARFAGSELADDHPYTLATTTLKALQRDAQRTDVATTVRAVVKAVGLIPDLAATGDELAIRRVQRVIFDAQVFSEETNAGLNAFLRWTVEQADDRDGASDPVLDDGSEAVRVMTVHASKGREFPVVILGGLAGSDSSRAGAVGFHPVTRAVEFKFKDIATAGYDAFKEYDKLADQAEAVRRHYVAATRAEHALVVPLELKRNKQGTQYMKTKGKPFAEVVAPLNPDGLVLPPESDHLAAISPSQFGDATVEIALPETPQPDLERITEEFQARQEHRFNNASDSGGRKLTATTIAHAHPETEDIGHGASSLRAVASNNGWIKAAGQPEVRRIGDHSGYGSVFGTVVHDLMDAYTTDAHVPTDAVNIAGIHELDSELIPAAIRAVRALAAHPIVAGAFEGTHHREIPVISTVGGIAVDGIIDLLYFDDVAGGWVIADYKTDAYASSQLVDDYFTQLQIYAHLLGEKWKIVRCELLFIRGDEVEVRTLNL